MHFRYMPPKCRGAKDGKLINSIYNFIMKKFEKLSRAEMKNVRGGVAAPGGNCCCSHVSGDSGSFSCGMSQADAQKDAAGMKGGLWCCASCSAVGAPAPCEA
jgi:hypothetical protein